MVDICGGKATGGNVEMGVTSALFPYKTMHRVHNAAGTAGLQETGEDRHSGVLQGTQALASTLLYLCWIQLRLRRLEPLLHR